LNYIRKDYSKATLYKVVDRFIDDSLKCDKLENTIVLKDNYKAKRDTRLGVYFLGARLPRKK